MRPAIRPSKVGPPTGTSRGYSPPVDLRRKSAEDVAWLRTLATQLAAVMAALAGVALTLGEGLWLKIAFGVTGAFAAIAALAFLVLERRALLRERTATDRDSIRTSVGVSGASDRQRAARSRRRAWVSGVGALLLLGGGVAIALTSSPSPERKCGGDTPPTVSVPQLDKPFTSGHARLQVLNEVKVPGEADWANEVRVIPGAIIRWLIGTKNVSNVTIGGVAVRNVLPPHVRLVPGSVRVITGTCDVAQKDGPLFSNGLGLGVYSSGGARYVLFTTVALDDFDECEVRVRNVTLARSDATPAEARDTADALIIKPRCGG